MKIEVFMHKHFLEILGMTTSGSLGVAWWVNLIEGVAGFIGVVSAAIIGVWTLIRMWKNRGEH